MSIARMNGTNYSLWSSIWKLMRLQLIIFFSGYKRGMKRQKISKFALTIVVIGFMGFWVYTSWSLLNLLDSQGLPLQAILLNFAFISLFGIPVLYGLGVSENYHVFYFISVVFVLFAMSLAAAAISSLLVMLVVHIFPARRVGEALAFLGDMSTLKQIS
jgi:hypothetical protein